MITRERLQQSDYGRGLLDLFDRLVKRTVTNWSIGGSEENRFDDEGQRAILSSANIVTSLMAEPGARGGERRHKIVLDIDHPAWLIPSTTPGHYHLYIDVPGGLNESAYFSFLELLARLGIIQSGYAEASIRQRFSNVRLPWVAKPDKPGEEVNA